MDDRIISFAIMVLLFFGFLLTMTIINYIETKRELLEKELKKK